jgi:hypothetical protein
VSHAHLVDDGMAPLRLVPDEDEIVRRAATAPLNEQLLFSAVITLMRDVKRLKQQVSDLRARERICASSVAMSW